jgi:hypothetical protein
VRADQRQRHHEQGLKTHQPVTQRDLHSPGSPIDTGSIGDGLLRG